MPRLKSVLLVPLLFAALSLTGAPQTHVVLMHTNDLHGHVLPENGAGGLAIIAAIVKQQHPDLLLDAGDMFTGTLISDTFYGESVMAVMNRMGYRASILGNHEFDYGLKSLQDRVRQAHFPVLSANVVLPYDEVGKTRVIPIKGIRFGIIGLTTEETPTTTHPKNVKDVQFLDVIHTMEQNLPALKKTSDFVIVLGHLAPAEELGIAKSFPEIKLIVSGHTHVELQQPIHENNALIVRSGSFGRFVGQVDMDFEGRTLKKILDQNVLLAAGVDPSDVMFRLAGRRLRREIRERRCELHLGEARHLPFGDRRFDAACAVHVVYFWTDPLAEFAEIRRVLRPSGRLLLGFRPRSKATLLELPNCAYTLRSVDEIATRLLQAGFAEAQGELEQIGQTEMAWMIARPAGAVGG